MTRLPMMSAGFVLAASLAASAAAEAGPREERPVFCTMEYRPVCGLKDGRRRTFSNLCVARREGARAIRLGACRRRAQ